ncbi:MAG: heme exporter protein CcmD [Alphaproteobacteria bacterium]|jgi:heme exporter protein CcmD|nr:heme exporter protein CcmD [Alphaproteobacteria bacterium]
MSEFFDMGGYARFVWPAYGVATAVMVALAWRIVSRARRANSELAALRAELGQNDDA